MNRQCSFIKASGERCRGAARGQHGLCWAHDPANAERRRRTASRGGRGKANREVANLKAELKDLIGKVEGGVLEPTRGNTMLRGYSVLLDLIRLERGIFVEEDLAARIEELKREHREVS